ncbi:MAG: RsiV family protein [Rhodanobacteraceae bacterium]
MKTLTSTCLITALATLMLGACNQEPAETSSAPASSASADTSTSAPIIAAAPASAGTAGLPVDHAATKHYKIAITLPTLPSDEKPLAGALRTTADNAKREFLKALPDPADMPEFANRQFELLLDFRIAADTPAFTSVRETGMQDTGGAHPIPVQASFVFDRKAGKLIALDDLFADADTARKTLANFAHDTLLKKFSNDAPKPGEGASPNAIREWKSNMVQMLNDGTKPTSVNYSVFVVRAGDKAGASSPGLTLIFPPYQVAPYVYGAQTVEVPANVFAKFLKPGYRSDFATL